MKNDKELIEQISKQVEKHLVTPIKEYDEIKLRIKTSSQFAITLSWLIKKFSNSSKFVTSIDMSQELGFHQSRCLALLKECALHKFVKEIGGFKTHHFMPIDPKNDDKLGLSPFLEEIAEKLQEMEVKKK